MDDHAFIDDGLPVLDLTVEATNRICTTCGHAAIVSPRRPSLTRRLLRMRPRPAECREYEYDMSGLAAAACGCRDVQHGS